MPRGLETPGSIIFLGFAVPPATQKFAEVRAGETAAYSALWFRSASPLLQLWLGLQPAGIPPRRPTVPHCALATDFLDVL